MAPIVPARRAAGNVRFFKISWTERGGYLFLASSRHDLVAGAPAGPNCRGYLLFPHITYVQVLVAGFLLQARSPSAAMTVVAAGMAVTA